MRVLNILALALLIVAHVAAAAVADTDDDSCIALSSVTSLSLAQGMTTGRKRTPNVPTLTCFGNCPSDAFLASAQCTQTGTSDNGLPSWKCVGHFPNSFAGAGRTKYSLGNIRVQCEGCTKAGDPNVRKGSCALTYSVKAVAGGRMRLHTMRNETSAGDALMSLFFFASLIGICYCIMKRRSDNSHQAYAYMGVPVDENGKPIPGALPQQVIHHHHGAGYGGGGGGFGTGMLTGYVLGDMLGRSSAHAYGGGYDGGHYDGGHDDRYSGGDDGGFGGTDSL